MHVIVGGVMLAMLLAALDQTIVAPAMSTIGASLGDAVYLPWVVTAYLLTSTATAPLYGKLADIHGRRRTIAAAILIFLLGSAICAAAGSMLVLVLGRAIQGLGGGGLFALSQTVIADLVPPRERGRFMAWISGTWAVAAVMGPLLGGYFAEHLHWSLIFWINLPLGLLALVIMNRPLRKLVVEPREQRLDWTGSALLILTTTTLLLAINWSGETHGWASPLTLALLLAAALLGGLLATRLLTAEAPLISIEILSNPIVVAISAATFLGQAAHLGMVIFVPVYLQHGLDMSVSASGTALLGLLLGTVSGAWTAGRLLVRMPHYKPLAIAGAALSSTAMLALALSAGTSSLLLTEVLLCISGFGTGITFPITTVGAQNAVDRVHIGAASGLVVFLRSLGGAVGVAALGAVALSAGLPLAQEGLQAAGVEPVPGEAFSILFYATAAAMAGTVAGFVVMREKPLQGRD